MVLEIGTGFGYQAAILAELARQVYSVEIIEEIAAQGKKRLASLGYKNIALRVGNGALGWPEHAPYDRIMVTAAPDLIPAVAAAAAQAGRQDGDPERHSRSAAADAGGEERAGADLHPRDPGGALLGNGGADRPGRAGMRKTWRAASSRQERWCCGPRADGWRYLLLRVFRTWDFPKGGVEAGEVPLQAAIREVEEETALTALEFRWGEVYRETARYSARQGGAVLRRGQPRGQQSRCPSTPNWAGPSTTSSAGCSYAEAKRLLPERLQPILEWVHELVEVLEPARR